MSVVFSKLGQLGRMGNQLWQISATVGYARQYGMDWAIPNWEYAQHFKGTFNQSQTLRAFPVWKERTFHYSKIPRHNNIDIYGYFQSRKYFQHCENEIKKMFQPNDAIQAILDKTPIEDNSCAIHIRRGDYVNLQDYHRLLPIEYYKNAVESVKADSYTILCEDADYVKEFISNLGLTNARHQHSGNDLLDWFIARQHKNHIIANSSYSWWFSYLSDKEGKRVFAPKKELWFGDAYKQNNVNDLYLDSWEII